MAQSKHQVDPECSTTQLSAGILPLETFPQAPKPVTEDYLAERASRGSRDKFEQAMANFAEVEPLPQDVL